MPNWPRMSAPTRRACESADAQSWRAASSVSGLARRYRTAIASQARSSSSSVSATCSSSSFVRVSSLALTLLVPLGASLAEHAPRNDQPLYLRRALEDVEDFGVAEPFFHQLLALAVFRRPHDARRRARHLHHQLPGVGFRH